MTVDDAQVKRSALPPNFDELDFNEKMKIQFIAAPEMVVETSAIARSMKV